MGGSGLSLTGDELTRLREKAPYWKVMHGREIQKTFVFPDFQTALDFVNRVGAVAKSRDTILAWARVDVTTSTHDAGGLTEKDFTLAAAVDRAYFTR